MTQSALPQTIHGVGRVVTQLTGSETLLAYSLMTTPAPVQVSPPSGPPSVAALTFVVSCPLDIGEATVTQITFNLPVGDPSNPDSGSLTDTADGISPSVSSSGPDTWQIGPGTAAGSFVLTPGSGQTGTIDAQGLTVALTGIQVSPVVGTAPVNVVEQAQADGYPLQTRVTGIAVPKFPYGFQAGNFAPSEPLVQHGGTVTLTWVGSTNATYTLVWGTNSQVVTDVRTWTSPPLVDATTFILEVTAQEAGQTVTQYFSTTVIVADPDLTATSLTVLTTSSLQGGVTVGADLAVTGTSSAATLSGTTLNVSGAGTIGTLAVNGAAMASSLAVNGNVGAVSINVGNLAATGNVTADSMNTSYLQSTGQVRSVLGYDGTALYVAAPAAHQTVASYFTTGDSNAMKAENNSGQYPTIWTVNNGGGPSSTALYGEVGHAERWGFCTDGRIGSTGGTAHFTQVPTREGPRAATSPLSLQVEVHASGRARLHEGRAFVEFDAAFADLIVPGGGYRVLTTPLGACWLYVASREDHGFGVAAGGGDGDVEFDWLVVAPKRSALDSADPHEMPAEFPRVAAATASGPLSRDGGEQTPGDGAGPFIAPDTAAGDVALSGTFAPGDGVPTVPGTVPARRPAPFGHDLAIPASPAQGLALTQFTASDTLLTYALMTAPAPVQVSPQAGPPSVAALTFVVSCPLAIGEATVTQITFNLPVGDPSNPDSGSLTDTANGISPSVSSSGPDSWQIGPGAAPGSFVLTPGSGQTGTIDAQGLTVALTGIQVSPVVGTAPVNIVEQAQADGYPPQARVTGIAVPKFPYGFYAGNFAASTPQVQHGGTAALTWVGSVNATYTIFWGTGSQVVSGVRTWTSPPLDDTTSFILEVAAQQDGQTVKQYFSTTVIVANPDITATSLRVLTTSALQGAVTVGAVGSPANLTVNGTATASALAGSSLDVSGAGSLASLTVSGPANLSTMQAGSVSASNARLAAATINSLTARDGRVSMFGQAQGITPGSWDSPRGYVAPTDGYAIGVIGFPSSHTDGCMAWALGRTGGVTMMATGGNVGYFGPGWGKAMGSNPNSFSLPVPAGNSFYVGVKQGSSGQQSNAPYWFYWVPVGSGNVSQALEQLPDGTNELAAPGAREEHHRSDGARWELIAIWEQLLGRGIDDTTKQRMIAALRSL
ncbi:MAG TPA: hypothetical protein VGB66_02800 [Longimicrobium sp.]